MPVPAVIAGGMPTVSSGSQIVTLGIISGWKMIFFVWVASSVTTPARPTSEPVPAVVGTATIGAMPAGSARVHQSPTSSKSHIGRVCPAMKATTLPTSSAEPPPKAMTPSCRPSRRTLTPASTLAATGFGRTSEKTAQDEAGGAERVERAHGHRHRRKARVGDEKRTGDAGRSHRLRQLGDAPGAEADRRRIVPVSPKLHGVLS